MSGTPPNLDGANDASKCRDLDRSANTRTLASSGESWARSSLLKLNMSTTAPAKTVCAGSTWVVRRRMCLWTRPHMHGLHSGSDTDEGATTLRDSRDQKPVGPCVLEYVLASYKHILFLPKAHYYFMPWAEASFRWRRQKRWDQMTATRADTHCQWVLVLICGLNANNKQAVIAALMSSGIQAEERWWNEDEFTIHRRQSGRIEQTKLIVRAIPNATLKELFVQMDCDDDDCFYYRSWGNNVVIAFGTLPSGLT